MKKVRAENFKVVEIDFHNRSFYLEPIEQTDLMEEVGLDVHDRIEVKWAFIFSECFMFEDFKVGKTMSNDSTHVINQFDIESKSYKLRTVTSQGEIINEIPANRDGYNLVESMLNASVRLPASCNSLEVLSENKDITMVFDVNKEQVHLIPTVWLA